MADGDWNHNQRFMAPAEVPEDACWTADSCVWLYSDQLSDDGGICGPGGPLVVCTGVSVRTTWTVPWMLDPGRS